MTGVSRGYFWSILTMMGTPFLAMSGFAFVLWRNAQRDSSDPEAEA